MTFQVGQPVSILVLTCFDPQPCVFGRQFCDVVKCSAMAPSPGILDAKNTKARLDAEEARHPRCQDGCLPAGPCFSDFI